MQETRITILAIPETEIIGCNQYPSENPDSIGGHYRGYSTFGGLSMGYQRIHFLYRMWQNS